MSPHEALQEEPTSLRSVSILLLFALSSSARQSPSVQEPEYVNQYFLLGPDGKLVRLESQTVRHQMKNSNHFISVKVKSLEIVDGPKSPVGVEPDAHFVVRMSASADTDPTTLVKLVPFTVGKKAREVLQSTASGYIICWRQRVATRGKLNSLTSQEIRQEFI